MRKFREGWKSFREGLDKRHIWEYWSAAWNHAWEIWWGAGVIGVLCTALTLYYAPSRWILGWVFAWVFLVAGYFIWRPYHVRLPPKLEFGTLHTPYTRTGGPNEKRRFVQVLVKCATESPVENCRGQLLHILKWVNSPDGKWEPTHIDETLDLLWSNVDVPSITLEPGADIRLNVFFVENTSRSIVPFAGRMSARMIRDSVPFDIFRFDVRVAAKDCPPKYISVKVIFGDQRDELRPEIIENET